MQVEVPVSKLNSVKICVSKSIR